MRDGDASASAPPRVLGEKVFNKGMIGSRSGTGGLTRLVDKRKVRRDLADVFATLAEGIKGKRAVEWRLVDAVLPRSRFAGEVRDRALALAGERSRGDGPGITLDPLGEFEPGQIANWIAKPSHGIHGLPFEFEYVRREP